MSKIKSQLLFSDLTGGLNTTYDKENINSTTKKTETPDMVNVEYFKLGGIKTMNGNIKVGENDNSIQNSPVVGGWEYTQGSKRYMIIGLENGEVRLYEPSLDKEDSNENPFVLLYKFPSTSKRMSFCNMNNGVIVTNGIDDLIIFDKGSKKIANGSVSFTEGDNIITGTDTYFTHAFKINDTIQIDGAKGVYTVKDIFSDNSMRVEPNIELEDYKTYYKWDGSSTNHIVKIEIPDISQTEVPDYMPNVMDVYQSDGDENVCTIKHFAGNNSYVSYNDIKSPFVLQSGRICRIDYANNTSSFITDNPKDPVNSCTQLTHKGYFVDINSRLYKVNDDNSYTLITDGVYLLVGDYFTKYDNTMYKIDGINFVEIDTNVLKIFPNDDDIVFYIKDLDIINNDYRLYYYSDSTFEYLEQHKGEVISENSFVIDNIDDIIITCGITRNSNQYTFPVVTTSDENAYYISLHKEVDGPGTYANVVMTNLTTTCRNRYFVTGCIGYKKVYENDILVSNKLYYGVYASTPYSQEYPDSLGVYGAYMTNAELEDGFVNALVNSKHAEGITPISYSDYNKRLSGQSYLDAITNKSGIIYVFHGTLDKGSVTLIDIHTNYTYSYSNKYPHWDINNTILYCDLYRMNNSTYLNNAFISSYHTNVLYPDNHGYFYTFYFDNWADLRNYFSYSGIFDDYDKHLGCYQDNTRFEINGEVVKFYNNTILNQYNLSLSGDVQLPITYPFILTYNIDSGADDIYTTSKSRYANNIYSEPNENSIRTNPHEPYSVNQIKVYGNEEDPLINIVDYVVEIVNNASNGIYTFNPLFNEKVYGEIPDTSGAGIYYSDVQLLNAVMTNTDPDAATGENVNVPVRGLALQFYNGRLWVGGEKGLFYSAVGLPNNWDIRSDAGAIYDLYNDSSPVKALGLFSEYLMVHKEFSTYILTCPGKAAEMEIKPFSNITCESQQSWIVSNTKYFVYSKDFMDIYPLVQHTVFNDKFLGEPITQKVRDIFRRVRIEDTDCIFCVSRPKERQMVFYLPTNTRDGSGEALIFDFQTKSWLLRDLPNWTEVDNEGNLIKCVTDVTCAFNFNNNIYIGTRDGLVLKEFTSESFKVLVDGEIKEAGLHAYYKSPWFDWVGGYTQSFAEFIVELDSEHDNHFFIRTQKDGQSRYEDREIDLDKITRNSKSLIWADDNGPEDSKWDEKNWSKLSFENIRMLLPNNVFEDFQVEFRAIKPGEHFCIYQYGFRRIETEEDPW